MPPKLLWLQKHEPEIFKSARYILGSYDYITYKLSGKLTLEKNWALESGMFNVRTEQWIPHILHSAGITQDMLPPVKAPTEIVGPILKEVAEETGPGGCLSRNRVRGSCGVCVFRRVKMTAMW